MNYRITIAYDGTQYQGWQLQGSRPTIQGMLSAALATIEGKSVTVHGAGRTDAGVHAKGQVASFSLSREWEGKKLCAALNGNLPRDIRVWEAVPVADDFHARFAAREKTYRYQLYTGEVMNPLRERFAWHYPWPIQTELLQQTGKLLLGRHDFTVFTVASCVTKTRVRTLTDFHLTTEKHRLQIFFSGDGFLRYQIRRMVSALLALNRCHLRLTSFTELIGACQQYRATALAPAKGLTLMKVGY